MGVLLRFVLSAGVPGVLGCSRCASTLYRTAVEHAVPCCCRDCPPWPPRFLNPQHRYVLWCCLVQHNLNPPIAVGSFYRQAPDIVSCYLDQCRFLPLPCYTCCCPCKPTSSPAPPPFPPALFNLFFLSIAC